jgi:hypothetical protein
MDEARGATNNCRAFVATRKGRGLAVRQRIESLVGEMGTRCVREPRPCWGTGDPSALPHRITAFTLGTTSLFCNCCPGHAAQLLSAPQ